jgi:hypothetical protein
LQLVARSLGSDSSGELDFVDSAMSHDTPLTLLEAVKRYLAAEADVENACDSYPIYSDERIRAFDALRGARRVLDFYVEMESAR